MKKLNKKSSGLTLIEILAVLVLLGLVIALVAPNIFEQLEGGKAKITTARIGLLEGKIQEFYLDCGFFPSTEPGLESLRVAPSVGRQCKDYRTGGYVSKESELLDGWEQPFEYVYPGQNNPGKFDIWSIGPDGQSGTDDDITNWEDNA